MHNNSKNYVNTIGQVVSSILDTVLETREIVADNSLTSM